MSQTNSSFNFRVSLSVWVVMGLIVVFFTASHCGRMWLAGKAREQAEARAEKVVGSEVPVRLAALSPSSVEMLFAMGLGDHVVGISRFSEYPPEALRLPRVCGYMDVDFERLLSLDVDCVVMLNSQRSLVKKFDELGVRTVSVDHASMDGIIDSFNQIAEVCGHQEQARKITERMKAHIEAVKQTVAGRVRPSVLVCIHYEVNASQPTQVVVSGNSGFHQELIEIAGGKNAYQGPVAFPMLSRENLIHLDPDVLIVLTLNETLDQYSKKELIAQWGAYSELKAVKNNRVVIVAGNRHFIPGPRSMDTLDEFVKALSKKGAQHE
jgi:iron complex transport system substrate-binding protein